MFAHAVMDYPLLASSYYNDIWGYVPVYVLLALSVGFALSAIRVGGRTDRILGTAVFFVGLLFFAMAAFRSAGLWLGWET